MPKDQTLEIQNFIKDLGNQLGFISKMEVQLEKSDIYSPIYDVVWFLNLEENFKFQRIYKYIDKKVIHKDINMLPIAAFEIEGAATSSKNQIGNISNLTFGNLLYKFVVVNNEAAIPERDSYRRGLKIVRYFNENLGNENIIFLDWSQIKNSYEFLKLKEEDKLITINDNKEKTRKGYGGESKSIDVFNKIIDDFSSTGLEVKQDYIPDKCRMKFFIEDYIGKKICEYDKEVEFYLKKEGVKDPNTKEIYSLKRINDKYYLPKIDVVLGFNMPNSFIKWLKGVGNNIEYDILNNPIIFALKSNKVKQLFIPLIAIEIESSVNKHLNGGIINMLKNTHLGLLISKNEAKRHLKYFKRNGCNNVYFYDYEREDN